MRAGLCTLAIIVGECKHFIYTQCIRFTFTPFVKFGFNDNNFKHQEQNINLSPRLAIPKTSLQHFQCVLPPPASTIICTLAGVNKQKSAVITQVLTSELKVVQQRNPTFLNWALETVILIQVLNCVYWFVIVG